jgi:putative GTP pyrophosphokinase
VGSLIFEDERVKFREWFESNQPIFTRALPVVRSLLSELLTDSDQFSAPNVSGRIKSRDECVAKFARKYQTICETEKRPYEIKDYITDIVGLRVVCLYETDVPRIRKLVTEHFDVLEETDKTATVESHDDTFGYKGLHLDVKLKENRSILPEYSRFRDLKFELQIRTNVQDAWSVLDHKIKYKKNIPESLRRRINRLAALFELADQEFRNIRDETVKFEQPLNKEVALPLDANDVLESIIASLEWPLVLNAFTFSQLGQKHFPSYTFEGSSIDGFVGDLKTVNPSLTTAALDELLTVNLPVVNEYRQFQRAEFKNRLNPYTTVRHAMYLSDKKKHHHLLFNSQRETFEKWLKDRKPNPSS